MEANWDALEKALIVLYGKIETIENIQKQKGEAFNIFSVLQMERLEVETHSAFIYELISPKGSHSQGTKYLELFIHYVLNLSDFNLTNVKVKREDSTDEGRRIDFTLENDEYFIAIEMKIDASDQPKQLLDYSKYAEAQGKEAILYYLTLDGREASNDSAKDVEKKEEALYEKKSFSYDILQWIEYCTEKSATLPVVRETLLQYATLIRKITGQTSKEITMQVKEIINNPKMAQAATEMAQNLGYVWAIKEAEFWLMLLERLENKLRNQTAWSVDIEEAFWNDDEKTVNKLEHMAKKISEQRSTKDAMITGIVLTHELYQLDIYQFNSTKQRYYLSSNNKNTNIDEIAKKIGLKLKDKANRYGDSKVDIKFYGKNVENPSYELFNDEELEKLVNSFASEVFEHLIKLDNYS